MELARVSLLVDPEDFLTKVLPKALEVGDLFHMIVPPGGTSMRHYHRETEEIYIMESGAVRLFLGDATILMKSGDAVMIPRGISHHVENNSTSFARLLVLSFPRYDPDDVFPQ